LIFKQTQIDKFLKNPDTSLKCVVIYGSNEGLVSEYVKSFTKAVSPEINDPFQVAYLSSDDVNSDVGVLFAEYGSRSLMGGRRVIVIRDGDNNLTKNLKKLFEEVKSDTLIVIYSDSLNKKSSLVKLAEDNDDMAVIACYEDRDEDIYKTAKASFLENKITISDDALQLLCSRLSNDRKSNLGEIDKLMTYIGDRKNVVLEDVAEIISDTSSSSTDDVCFYTAGGDNEKSQKSFDRLLRENVEPISIIRALSYHFEKILNCHAMMEKGQSLDNAVSALVPMFFRKPSFKNQVMLWNRDKALYVLDILYKAERNCKTTNMPVDEIVSYALMQIASAANRLKKN
jgi:DNA polymerase-3 subunit delta